MNTSSHSDWRSAWAACAVAPEGFWRRETPHAHFQTSATLGVYPDESPDPPGRFPIPPDPALPPRPTAAPGAQVLARTVLELLRERDAAAQSSGPPTVVIDIGAGDGHVVNAFSKNIPDAICLGVDIRPRPKDLSPAAHWLSGFWDIDTESWRSPDGTAILDPIAHACTLADLSRNTALTLLVVGHEWLDELPTCVVRQATNLAAWEVIGPHGGCGTAPDRADTDWLARWNPHSEIAESGLTRDRAWQRLATSLRATGGYLVAIDYAHTRATRPARGTLTGYAHGVAVAPVADGSVNLTAHVAWDSLAAAAEQVPGCVRLADLDQAAAIRGHYRPAPPPDPWQDLLERNQVRALTRDPGPGRMRWLVHRVARG